MTSLTFDRYCDEIVTQTERLTAHVRGADMTAPVLSCPGWNLGQLLRHVGGDHRWAEEVVRTRATAPISDDLVNDPTAYPDEDESFLVPWLLEGAASLSATLRAAGPDALAWNPSDEQSAPVAFWARRMTYETAVHRADAALAAGGEFALERDLAVDAVEEWLEYSTFPEAFEPRPDLPELLGPGRTLHFDATDAGQWLVDLTGKHPVWRAGADNATATARGPATDLLLFFYRRPAPTIETHGDTALLDLWLTRAGFWLEV
ncbi:MULTISPECIES: maleylpyruvate isomerase family mycothiol-dependent enzyme [unclassified Streptomyces]|uniref:maleylpyruvate isomerase family mycothiol-dependent enzyme n=1 Tax=unclassified Streptomyces TaxID=2593676 RepID=UPI0023654706|nr:MULTISPECIES: maleylpyruvate isomerase family mycothiol-dependent enzyme [unclassified Streptomyces]MDF3148257.1 maleylpyruvate isomerase family mycothiol-dependent enzyme [Streptomyces sp. T21Q-yed]WDF44350.1 maleylpyruvate isomerase family mycothiol-dependent enzyme [Streptomyces sp. T12]